MRERSPAIRVTIPIPTSKPQQTQARRLRRSLYHKKLGLQARRKSSAEAPLLASRA